MVKTWSVWNSDSDGIDGETAVSLTTDWFDIKLAPKNDFNAPIMRQNPIYG
jgi:hypothetical protein